jgi:hypothetical protein
MNHFHVVCCNRQGEILAVGRPTDAVTVWQQLRALQRLGALAKVKTSTRSMRLLRAVLEGHVESDLCPQATTGSPIDADDVYELTDEGWNFNGGEFNDDPGAAP